MYRINLVFTKKGLMRFISHLDLMRLFSRAIRRAGLPVKMTEGFSPHPKLSINRALKLGLESDNEQASIFLKDKVSPEDFRKRLQQQLPEGIAIKQVDCFLQ
jgi:radical SAM-linked protein